MDTEVLKQIATEAADAAVAKMREFHLDDLKVLGERMDLGFEQVDRRFEKIESRLDGMDKRLDGMDRRLDGMDKRLDGMDKRLEGVESALTALLKEFKERDDKIHSLNQIVEDLKNRVVFLEQKLLK